MPRAMVCVERSPRRKQIDALPAASRGEVAHAFMQKKHALYASACYYEQMRAFHKRVCKTKRKQDAQFVECTDTWSAMFPQ